MDGRWVCLRAAPCGPNRNAALCHDVVEPSYGGLNAWRSTGAGLWAPYFLSLLAHGYSELRQFDEAAQRITEATTGIRNSGERWNEAETCRRWARLRLGRLHRVTGLAVSSWNQSSSIYRAAGGTASEGLALPSSRT
jgi:hypothetical protein